MIAAIVSLILAGFILLIGFGDRLCEEIRFSKVRLLAVILIIITAAVITPYKGENYIINYAGLAMLMISAYLIIVRIKLRFAWKNMFGILFIAGIILLYRYYIPEVVDNAIFGGLFAVVLTIAGYLTAKRSYDIIVNLSIGIALGQALLNAIPYYGAELVIGGKGEVIILTVVAALLIQQIVLSIAAYHGGSILKRL